MKLLADESVDGPLVQWLRERGHDVAWIAEFAPGIEDSAVVAIAEREGRGLLTFDRDFGELVYRGRGRPSGVLLVRIRARTPESLTAQFERCWTVVASRLDGNFVVVARGRVRIRPLPAVRN